MSISPQVDLTLPLKPEPGMFGMPGCAHGVWLSRHAAYLIIYYCVTFHLLRGTKPGVLFAETLTLHSQFPTRTEKGL